MFFPGLCRIARLHADELDIKRDLGISPVVDIEDLTPYHLFMDHLAIFVVPSLRPPCEPLKADVISFARS